ncbi:hypothetical protein ACG2QI_00445 [Bacillus sp. GM2]|uniref:hypothetical protein n=1 Tax=Bacillus sp. GM2 TaxID=3373599 RepID=UPI003F8DACC0
MTKIMPIEIPISPDYKLTSDERNIIVNERYFTDPTKALNWTKRFADNPDLRSVTNRTLAGDRVLLIG